MAFKASLLDSAKLTSSGEMWVTAPKPVRTWKATAVISGPPATMTVPPMQWSFGPASGREGHLQGVPAPSPRPGRAAPQSQPATPVKLTMSPCPVRSRLHGEAVAEDRGRVFRPHSMDSRVWVNSPSPTGAEVRVATLSPALSQAAIPEG